jgi:hypothetical protein
VRTGALSAVAAVARVSGREPVLEAAPPSLASVLAALLPPPAVRRLRAGGIHALWSLFCSFRKYFCACDRICTTVFVPMCCSMRFQSRSYSRSASTNSSCSSAVHASRGFMRRYGLRGRRVTGVRRVPDEPHPVVSSDTDGHIPLYCSLLLANCAPFEVLTPTCELQHQTVTESTRLH